MLSSVIGTVALVFYTFPYLGIIFVPLTFFYWIISKFYRRTSVETKRLESLLRSNLYGTFSGWSQLVPHGILALILTVLIQKPSLAFQLFERINHRY